MTAPFKAEVDLTVKRNKPKTIDKKELQESVARFTEYAEAHPELTFLVTPVGCGGGGWRPWMVSPMFRNASKLENVYLPQEFWDEL